METNPPNCPIDCPNRASYSSLNQHNSWISRVARIFARINPIDSGLLTLEFAVLIWPTLSASVSQELEFQEAVTRLVAIITITASIVKSPTQPIYDFLKSTEGSDLVAAITAFFKKPK